MIYKDEIAATKTAIKRTIKAGSPEAGFLYLKNWTVKIRLYSANISLLPLLALLYISFPCFNLQKHNTIISYMGIYTIYI